jgi:hypothetical protein
VKGRENFGSARTGVVTKAFLRAWKAVLVSGVQMNKVPFFKRLVSGLEIMPNRGTKRL